MYLRAGVEALKASQKTDPIEVKFDSWCDYVTTKHLEKDTKCWHIEDSRITTAKTPKWKNTVSNALQILKKEDLVTKRLNPERWHVFRD